MRKAKNYKREQQERLEFLWSVAPEETRERIGNKLREGIYKVHDNLVKKGLIVPDNKEEEE